MTQQTSMDNTPGNNLAKRQALEKRRGFCSSREGLGGSGLGGSELGLDGGSGDGDGGDG